MPNIDSKKRSRSPSAEADGSNTDKHHHKRVNVGTDAAHPKAEPAPEQPAQTSLATVDEDDELGESTSPVASSPTKTPADFPVKPTEAAAAAANAAASSGTKPAATTPPTAMIHMRCLIVTQDASIIIGKAGAHVNEIREKSGARVVVSESIPGNPERILNVSGPLDAVSKVLGIAPSLVPFLINPLHSGIRSYRSSN